MAKADISAKIGIDGESEFRKQLQNCEAGLKVLRSEMQVVTAEFGRNAQSEEALTATNDVLLRSVSSLKDKLELQNRALAACVENYGEADERTMAWHVAVNKTEAELKKSERTIKLNEDAMAGLGDEAQETGDDLDKAAEKGSTFGDRIAAGMTAAIAVLGAVSAAAGALAKEVISSTGELEQNMGGAEAVFGDYANNIQRWSENAFRTMGVSQSEYLASANKIGALFQGAGMDQEKALTMTADAMQRAADMASVMGINTEDALNAIQGAAKGNYTMMDNLGVAMNNTALESYAAEKGFDKLFKEMDNAEKAEVAMQYFFENTSQYAGNFAREATQTLSGSFGMLNAAKDSLIAGLGNADADIGQLTSNVLQALSTVIENVVPVLENLAGALPTVISAAVAEFGPMIPDLVNTGMELVNAVLDGVLQVLPQLSKAAIDIIKEFIGYILEHLDELVEAGVEILNALIDGLIEMIPELTPVAVDTVLELVDSLISNVDTMVDAAIEIILALANGLLAALPTLLDKAPELIQKLTDAIIKNAPKLLEAAVEIILSLALGILENLPKLLEAAWDICKTLLEGIAESFVSFVEMGGHIVEGFIQGWKDKFEWAWNQLKEWFNGVIQKVKDWLGIHSPSTKFAEIGEFSAMGFGVGFDKEFGEVTKTVVGDIEDAYDKAYQAARKSINSQVKLFDDFAEDLKEETASVEAMLERWSNQTTNLDRYTRNLKKAAEYGIDKGLVESLSDGSTKSANYLDTIIGRIEELGVSTEGLGDDAQQFVNEFNGAFRRTGEAKDAFARTATEISGSADQITDHVSAVSKIVEELKTQYEETYNAARDSIGGQVKLFDDFAAKIDEETSSADLMLEKWAKQTENLAKYAENLRKATSAGIDTRILESLSDGSAESAGYLATIVERIDELSDSTEGAEKFISDFNAAFEETEKAKDNFAEAVANIKGDYTELLEAIQHEAENFESPGETMIDSIIEGLDAKSGDLYGKITEIVNTALLEAQLAARSVLPTATANAGVVASLNSVEGVRDALADSVNALGMVQNTNSGDLSIVIQTNGREFYRATLDDFRLVSSQNPIIVNDF